MNPIEAHKKRILATIKANATRNENRIYKPEVKRNHYPRKRFRFDTPNIGEVTCVVKHPVA